MVLEALLALPIPLAPCLLSCWSVPVISAYTPRHPEKSLLYRVIAEQLETFLARQQERERAVPAFVEEEFRSFLRCGIKEFGFLRLRCTQCGKDRLLAYFCKNRGFCSSCCGRRMADTAAHLVDRVFPAAPVRQWVFSLPYALRYRVAFDSGLFTDVLGIMIGAVFEFLKRRARDNGIPKAKCGAVAFVQRFGSAANLNPHSHILVLDGVYASLDGERPLFYPERPPDPEDVAAVAARVAMRVAELLERRDGAAALDPDEPAMAGIDGASITGTLATGPDAGQRVKAARDFQSERNFDERRDEREERFESRGSRCAIVSGFSVHAGVSIRAEDRKGFERLVRYVARPYAWSHLMARVFEFDVLNYPNCNGRLKILAALHPLVNTRKILKCMNLPGRALPMARAVSGSAFEEF